MKQIVFLLSCFFVFAHLTSFVHARDVIATDPYDYQQMMKDLSILKKKYGDLIEVQQIGKTNFGHGIWAFHLGKGQETILFVGAHHGREWITTNLLMMMLEQYTDAYQKNKNLGEFHSKSLDEISIWFVPMLNPDGIDIQQGNIPYSSRKVLKVLNHHSANFTRWKANAVGIDLNRQYPADWEDLPSPEYPSYQFYKGLYPFQASEVQALVPFIYKNDPKVTVAYHSTGQEIYWRYGEKQNVKRDYRLASKVAKLTGYPLKDPPEHAMGGGLTDWFIVEFQKPGLTIELCRSYYETNPPIEELEEEWKRNQYVGLLIIDELLKSSSSN